MTEQPEHMTLAGPLGVWTVHLKDERLVQILADGYSEEGDHLVFSVLMEGSPPFFVDIAMIPLALVKNLHGGSPGLLSLPPSKQGSDD